MVSRPTTTEINRFSHFNTYEIGFIKGADWADENIEWIDFKDLLPSPGMIVAVEDYDHEVYLLEVSVVVMGIATFKGTLYTSSELKRWHFVADNKTMHLGYQPNRANNDCNIERK